MTQRVNFHTKCCIPEIPIWVNFESPRNWILWCKVFLRPFCVFITIWFLWPIVFLFIWHIFLFGMSYQEKSGNPETTRKLHIHIEAKLQPHRHEAQRNNYAFQSLKITTENSIYTYGHTQGDQIKFWKNHPKHSPSNFLILINTLIIPCYKVA
jgi:hypothetical protein